MSATRVFGGVAIAIALASPAGRDEVRGDAQQVFRSDVAMVRVDVLVTDDRRPVAGLRAGDFDVRDNGVPQDVQLVPAGTLPLDVYLAVDTSQSVAGPRLVALVDAASAVLAALGPRDRVTFLGFGHGLSLLAERTGDFDTVRQRLPELRAGGATSLYDAVLTSLLLREGEPSRALLLVFSDGRDTMSWTRPSDMLGVLEAADVSAYVVSVGSQPSSSARSDITRHRRPVRPDTDLWLHHGPVLDLIASVGGGRVVPAERIDQLAVTFVQILDEYRQRYLLAYTPQGEPAAGWHQIDVRLKSRKGVVRARRGYFVG